MSIPLRTIQKINSIKKMFVRQTEWELAEALRDLSQAEMILNQLESEFKNLLTAFNERQSSGISALELIEWTEWLNAWSLKIQAQVKRCQQFSEAAEEIRLKLLERQRNEEIWQRLKEKRLEITNRELRRLEQTELDEISLRNRQYRIRGM